MSTEKVIQKNIDELLPHGSSVLIGFSGGVDSVLLTKVLRDHRPDVSLYAAHVNHMLREDAQSDAVFCDEFCQKNNIPFVVTNEDVNKFCSDEKLGTEEGARILRHKFFRDWMFLKKIDYLCLGHHKNDRAETVILNFLRGSGIHGLSSMKARDRNIIRPLLAVDKSEIINLATEKGLSWVEDHTNHESIYDRNWVRNIIIPELETRRSGIVNVLNRNAEQFELMSDYLRKESMDFLKANLSINERDLSKSTFFTISDFQYTHLALQNEIIRSLYALMNGSSARFSGKIVKEFHKWLNSKPKNGESTTFFGDVRFVNKHGVLGYKTSNTEIIKRLNNFYSECKDLSVSTPNSFTR